MSRVMVAGALIVAWGHLGAQDKRDTVLAVRLRADCDSLATWRVGQQPQWYKRQITTCRADTDSLKMARIIVPPPPVNQPPKAEASVVCANTTRLCSANASASTDDKGVTSYVWSWGDGANSSGVTAAHTFAAAGTYAVAVTVRDAEGLTASTTRIITLTAAQPPPDTVVVPPPDTTQRIAELPRSVPSFTIPPPTRVVLVTGDLQAALDTARRGDELRLSGTFTGNYTFAGCAAGWITVRGAATLPATGVRVTPTTAANFARLITPNTDPALASRGPACRWHFTGLDVIGELVTTQYLAYGLIRFGEGGDVQNSLSLVPTDLVLSHSYVHGVADHNNTRCVVLNSANSIIRDSWISECHARGSDSQAILGWNGPGPYLIENNYLAGAGENIMFGGADPGINGLIPSDITVRRNHIIKPLAWRSGPWSIKNLFELKSSRRTLLENNILENSWPASQEGMAIVIKSSKDASPTATWQGSVDLTIRYNIVRNAAVGLNLQARDGPTTLPVARVVVTQNWFDRIGAEGRAALMLLTHDLTDVSITSNTFQHDPSVGTSRGSAMVTDYSDGAAKRMEWRGNLMGHGAYGFIYSGAIGTAALDAMIGDGSWKFTGNTMVGATDLAPRYPPGTTWLSAWPTPPAPGADLADIARRTAGVVVP